MAPALNRRTGLKELDNKSGHQGGEAAVALCPGHNQLFDGPVTVFELRNTGFDEGLELAGVQVPPFPLSPAVDVRSLGGACQMPRSKSTLIFCGRWGLPPKGAESP